MFVQHVEFFLNFLLVILFSFYKNKNYVNKITYVPNTYTIRIVQIMKCRRVYENIIEFLLQFAESVDDS